MFLVYSDDSYRQCTNPNYINTTIYSYYKSDGSLALDNNCKLHLLRNTIRIGSEKEMSDFIALCDK